MCMHLASCSATLRVERDGNLAGLWKAFQIGSISESALAWIGIPPLTEVALRSALNAPKQHVYLVEPEAKDLSRALIVAVLGRHRTLHRVCCKLIGMLPFHPTQSLKSKAAIDVEAMLGDTDMADDDGKQAWSIVRSCRLMPKVNGFKDIKALRNSKINHLMGYFGARGSAKTSERTETSPLPAPIEQRFSIPYVIVSVDGPVPMDGFNIDSQYRYERTALHCAVWRDHQEIVSDLISQRANQTVEDELGNQALHLATERGNLNIVKMLTSSEVDVSQKCRSDGQTAFHRGALSGSIPVVELLGPKSHLDALDKSGQTALHISASQSYFLMTRLLSEWGVDTSFQDNRGRTALWWAARNGDDNIVELLLRQSSIDVNAVDEHGRAPLHLAARHGHEQVIRLLIEHPQTIMDIADNFGRTPMFHARLHGHNATVQLLSERSIGSSVNQVYWLQKSRHITRNDSKAAIEFLLEIRSARRRRSYHWQSHYADGPGDENLVIWAASIGHFEIVEYLLETGMYPDTNTIRAGTSLQRAAANGDEQIMKLLLDTGEVDINHQEGFSRAALFGAVMSGNPAALEVLLGSDDIDLSIQDFDGLTALIHAAEIEDPAIITRLLATGMFDINHRGNSRYKCTALARAAAKGHEEVVKVLLSTGKVELDAKSNDQTPLQLAAESGHAEVTKLLLETGRVDINATGMFLKTPLMLAAENGHHCVVSLLLDTKKADMGVRNMTNETALSLAASNGHDEIVTLLLLHLQKINFRDQDEGLKATLFEGARYGLAIIIRELLKIDSSLDVDVRDNCMRTPLILAAICGKLEFIKELLVCGKTVNVNAQDEYLKTPLSYAAERGNEAVVMELLVLGDRLDINLEDSVGCTPLFYAAIHDRTGVANLLWSTGRAKFGSAELPMELHVFDEMLQYIDNVRISVSAETTYLPDLCHKQDSSS